MKSQLYDINGNKKADIALPSLFETPLRLDLVGKYFEAEKFDIMHSYSTWEESGKRHSGSGRISHRRHKWRSAYGKGVSRVPRKILWRRGTQFYFVGTEVSSARGGRVSHPPKGIHTPRKINKKEKTFAFNVALASTFNAKAISERYSSLGSEKITSLVIESLPSKTKDILSTMKKMFGEVYTKLIKNRTIRAGIGKTRGRKYKSNAGILIVTGTKEVQRFKGLDVKAFSQLTIADLYPLGRITLYTKQALDEIQEANKWLLNQLQRKKQ